MTAVAMPRLSDSMEEGTIVRWHKRAGDAVAAGDVLAEIETDKATMEYEAEEAGVLEILAAAGETVAVGAPIARLGGDPRGRVRATPVARRLARELGADLASIAPTGRRGQVMKRDVLAVGNGKAVVATGAPAEVPPAPERSPAPTVKTPADAAASAADASSSPPPAAASLTATQRTIASRMTHSRASVPDFDAEIEIDMAACLALRAQLREHADPAPSINDMIVKACALTLRDHPRVNGAFADAGFTVHDDVHVGVAVATEDALVVPVVRDADARSLGAIAATTRALAAKVRDRAITPAELEGATFTVSNLGMFGVTRFTAVIDEPQAAILAVGAVVDRPVGRDGQIVLAPMLTVTLAADHRIVYGADAARFLAALRELLENPMRMLL